MTTWNKVERIEPGQNKVERIEPGQNEVERIEPGQNGLEGIEPGQNEVERIEPGQNRNILKTRERNLIGRMVEIRIGQGLSQARLAAMSGVKQPVIARMEKSVHSPQISSLLRVLEPMGYTLKIVPVEDRR